MKLYQRVAIITGSGRGIGRGITHYFAQEGASVIIATMTEDEGKTVEKEIREKDGKAIFIHTDVTSECSITAMVSQTIGIFGRIDLLVNNAGITPLNQC